MRSIVALQQTHARATLLEEECDLAEAVAEALRLKQSQLQQAGVQVTETLEALPPVKVDRHRLMQILHNLLSNAHQALEAAAPGERRLELRLWGDGQWAHLEVKDNGQGIAPEVRKRLFSQGFSTRKDGHGMGLHSSALSAQLMGAQLSLESPGLGPGSHRHPQAPPLEVRSAHAGAVRQRAFNCQSTGSHEQDPVKPTKGTR